MQRKCPKCGTQLKKYPDDFPKPFSLPAILTFSPTLLPLFLAGNAGSEIPVLVCPKCGHNEDLRD
jgi:ssDNA-binding Zn-finger/Zn-ribbon topoisomerase 1